MTIAPIDIKADVVQTENVIRMNMMIWKLCSLIPFVVFLANYERCQEASPDIWKHGPEYTFHVGVNSSMLMPNSTNHLCSNVTITLNCRSFPSTFNETVGLQCYVKNAQITNYKVIMTNESREIVKDDDKSTSPFQIGANKFEIIYDKKGIKEFKYEPPLSQWCLNMLRAVANQLNIGFDKDDQKFDSPIVGNENSTIGECETEWRVKKHVKDLGKSWNSTECGLKEFSLGMNVFGETGQMITIDKKRFTNKCSKSTPYVFGAKEIMKDVPASENMKMTSSVTSFSIGIRSFQSETKNTATEEKTNSTVVISHEEAIKLLLVDIKPAQDEFKMILNPSVTTILAYAPTQMVKTSS